MTELTQCGNSIYSGASCRIGREMNATRNPRLMSVLQGFDSGPEMARRRAVRAAQRLGGIVFGLLAVFLAWTVVADARDLASGAESRLVRIAPAELEQPDPPREAFWHESENGLFRWHGRFRRHRTANRSAPVRLRRGVPVVVADARPGDAAPFVGRIVSDRRSAEVGSQLGFPFQFVVRTARSPFWHFAQLVLVFPLFYLGYRLVPFGIRLFWLDLVSRGAASADRNA